MNNNIIPHFINGKKYSLHTDTLPIYNPALGEISAHVAIANQDICDQTIAAAKKAWTEWSQTPVVKRSRILFKFRELLETYQNDLAKIITSEHGKTLEDARGSVARAIEVVEFNCGILARRKTT